MGKILVLAGADSRDGLNGRIPRPFEVVHSGKTAMLVSAFSSSRVLRSVNFAFGGGELDGQKNGWSRAPRKEMRCTFCVFGQEMVNTGSKMAAR